MSSSIWCLWPVYENETSSTSLPVQELKGRFLIKGKRSNKLDAAFNNNSSIEDDSVSEEDEAADSKENGQKAKAKVSSSEYYVHTGQDSDPYGYI